jgi:hypothetical protein
MDFFTGAVLAFGVVTCPGPSTDYCPHSRAVGTVVAEVTLVEEGRFSLAATWQHFSDITDNNWNSLDPHVWVTSGDRGTEMYGLQGRIKLW